MKSRNSDHYFLQGGGEMGEKIREKDWSKTSLGDPSEWPQSLRTTLAIVLNSKFPMFLWWGSELLCFYNDAYRPSLGNEGKHPSILGMTAEKAWPEIWDIIKPLIDKVINQRESIWFDDMLVPIYRNGKIEDVYWTFSYSPVPDEKGQVSGVLVTCTETTEKVTALKRIEESDQRFRNTMQQAPVGITILRGPQYIVEMANDAYLKIVDKKESEFVGRPLFTNLPEIQNAVHALLDNVLNTGHPYRGNEVPIPLNRYGKQDILFFDFLYHPLKEEDGKISGVIVAVTEVTDKVETRKKIEESKRLYETITQNTPDLIYVFDLNYRFSYANEALLKMWGRTWDDSKGKSLLEIGYEPWHAEMHEREIDQVIATKKPVRGEVSFPHAVLGKRIYDYILVPVIDHNGRVEAIAGTTRDITPLVEAREKIEESDEKLRSLIKNAPFPIGVYSGEEMRIEVANESILSAWGKGDDVKGKLFNEVMPELKNQKIFDHLDHVYKSGMPFHAYNEKLKLVIDGEEKSFFYNYSFTPLFDSSGKVYGVMNTASDVTDLNLAKERVEESEQDLRSMALQAPIGICILDARTLVCEIVNDTFIQIAGKPREAIAGKYYWDTFAEAKPYYESALHKVATAGIPFYANEVELMLIRNGQEERMYVTFVYAPLKAEDGKVKKIAVWVLDNTQQVMARRKIQEDTEKLNIVIEASELGTWELNLKTMDATYSPRYLEIIGGYKKDLVLNHAQLLSHLHPGDLPIREKAFQDAMNTGILNYESRLLWKDQSVHWMEAKGKVFYDKENKPEKMIGTIRDITNEKNHQKELEESEQRFRNLIMQSPVAQAILRGKDHVVEMANAVLLNSIWRKKENEIIGKKIVEIFPELKDQQYLGLLNEVYTTGKKQSRKESFISLTGNDGLRNYYIDFEYAPLFSNDHVVSGIKITAVDVTEKVESRKIIEENEKRFRLLAEALPQLTWVTDEKGELEFASSKWKEYTGRDRINEREWKAIVHPDDYEKINADWSSSLATGNFYKSEVRLLNKNGEFRWHIVNGKPVLDKSDKIVKWVGAFTDTHVEKSFSRQLEEKVITRTAELKASEEKFYTLFNLSPFCNSLSDAASGKIIMVNDAFTKLLGYTSEESVGKTSSELGLLDPETRESMINTVKEKGKIENMETWFIKKSGERFIALVSSQVISMGGKEYILGAFNDISEVKKAEQHVNQKNIELKKMNQELQSFAYISSHDLQEPLRKIQTFATRITEKEENNLSGYGKEMFSRMQDAAERMQTLIQDLLAYSRTSTQERKFEKTDLNKIIAEVKDDLKEELLEKHATIETDHLCEADIIPFQFRQLMHNLIGNSLKFSNHLQAPHIKITSEIKPGSYFNNEKLSPLINYCHISVSDNGIGFEQQYSEKIFEVFQRLHGKKEYDGTGIGLSIVKKIVENHNGIIKAKGKPHEGATFDIYIPVK